jgi:hypothetical protein
LSSTLATLARDVPERTTIRQALALVLIAYSEAMGRELNLKGIRAGGGETPDGRPIIGQSIERTLDHFREPTQRTPNALGWVYAEEDKDDRRYKYFHLTDAGIEFINEVLDKLKKGELE